MSSNAPLRAVLAQLRTDRARFVDLAIALDGIHEAARWASLAALREQALRLEAADRAIVDAHAERVARLRALAASAGVPLRAPAHAGGAASGDPRGGAVARTRVAMTAPADARRQGAADPSASGDAREPGSAPESTGGLIARLSCTLRGASAAALSVAWEDLAHEISNCQAKAARNTAILNELAEPIRHRVFGERHTYAAP